MDENSLNLVFWISIVIAFAMAAGIGSNDVANALGSTVGSGSLTVTQAIIIGSICEFSGAILMGGGVSGTISKGIASESLLADSDDYMIGMLAALFGGALWLFLATLFGLPVSTTHSIVGGVLAYALVSTNGGVDAINWSGVGKIALSWVISPVAGALLAFLIHKMVAAMVFRAKYPERRSLTLSPLFTAGIVAIVGFFFIHESFEHINILTLLGSTLAIGVVTYLIVRIFCVPRWYRLQYMRGDEMRALRRQKVEAEVKERLYRKHAQTVEEEEEELAETRVEPAAEEEEEEEEWIRIARERGPQSKRFRVRATDEPIESKYLVRNESGSVMDKYSGAQKYFILAQVLSSIGLCVGHGANDVANAAGPLAGIVAAYNSELTSDVSVPYWVIVLTGVGIVVGLVTMGARVMATIGTSITKLNPLTGFVVQVATVVAVLVCSSLKMPISTTHILIGSVSGAGIAANGLGSLNTKVLCGIVISWLITLPIAGLTSCIIYFICRAIFL